jgi:uncharacterized protein YdeI (BOF family)
MNKMIKKIITLIITSSMISAGLLFLGISVMEQYTPAHASTLGALVARSNAKIAPNDILVSEPAPVTTDINNGKEKLLGSSISKSISEIPVASPQAINASVNLTTTVSTAPSIKISQILSDPKQFLDQVYTISGIATRLGDDKLLLNDGTGQILVEVEDELLGLMLINGQMVSIMGKLDDTDSFTGIEMDARTLTDQNGVVVMDDCVEDDLDDGDLDDDLDDDEDDLDDDDDSDDSSDDDSGDDLDADNEDDGKDD